MHNAFTMTRAAFSVLLLAGSTLLAGSSLLPSAQADAPAAALYDLADFGSPDDAASPFPVGISPAALVAGPKGTFYGLSQSGGAGGGGTVFKVQPYGTDVTPLYAFGSSDGTPSSLTLSAAGILYGTSVDGGLNANGLLFKLAADGTGYRALYAFSATDISGVNTDGASPAGPLLEDGGILYGEAEYGGPNGAGVVYSLHPDGSGFTALHTFGSDLSASTPSSTATDGQVPVGGLIQGLGTTLYGVTSNGGAGDTGTIFTIHSDGTGYSVLHEFSGADMNSVNTDGAVPAASLTLGTDGLLYGVTAAGGSAGLGVVFRLSPDGTGFTVLHEFSGGNDGNSPQAALVKDRLGDLYGTTVAGGSAGQGTMFLLPANGSGYVSLYSLQSGDGASPTLAEGSSGLVYGITGDGGVYSGGELFQLGLTRLPVHILWDNASGAVSLWSCDAGTGLFSYQNYGPYDGWTAKAVADGPDGLSRILWTHTSGAMCLFSLDNVTGSVAAAHTYGAYPGWTAAGVSVGADNTTHILWNNASGAVSLWNCDAGTGLFNYQNYGPYDGWTAKAVADGPDGLSRILWTHTSGAMCLFSLDNVTGSVAAAHTYGAYPGWTAAGVSVGADNTTHILWNNVSGQASLWNCDAGTGLFNYQNYGPYDGWTAKAVADDPDGLSRILWTHTSGAMALFSLDNVTGSVTAAHTYGAYPGWTAGALSVGF